MNKTCVCRGAAGQPRLFVPVVLVMMYNRWNGILVPDYGFMHLELIPMLVGFFTYKVATFVQAIEDALDVVERS
ncbi:ATP synthase protein I [Musa troglodytarum]|uniref:ATP synthase protein I n=1 Tax=Musa troglodytarum TaxID=320322 RepID=A0A9E7I0P7_9LILI|nr:ATP synthase protein I [Musa troglodytarum]